MDKDKTSQTLLKDRLLDSVISKENPSIETWMHEARITVASSNDNNSDKDWLEQGVVIFSEEYKRFRFKQEEKVVKDSMEQYIRSNQPVEKSSLLEERKGTQSDFSEPIKNVPFIKEK